MLISELHVTQIVGIVHLLKGLLLSGESVSTTISCLALLTRILRQSLPAIGHHKLENFVLIVLADDNIPLKADLRHAKGQPWMETVFKGDSPECFSSSKFFNSTFRGRQVE